MLQHKYSHVILNVSKTFYYHKIFYRVCITICLTFKLLTFFYINTELCRKKKVLIKDFSYFRHLEYIRKIKLLGKILKHMVRLFCYNHYAMIRILYVFCKIASPKDFANLTMSALDFIYFLFLKLIVLRYS